MKACLLLIASLAAVPLPAQVANEALANSIIAARQKNAQMMQQYSWNSRIEILEGGTVKDTRIDQCVYGPNKQVQRTLINDVGSPLPQAACCFRHKTGSIKTTCVLSIPAN